MTILNDLAQAAAVLLLLELFVVLLIFLAIAGGLAFGLRWARGKTQPTFDLVNRYVGMGARYVHMGTDYAAKPVLLAASFAERVKGTAQAIRREVRGEEHRDPHVWTGPPAAEPVAPPEQAPVAH
jgi:hypothetical protein